MTDLEITKACAEAMGCPSDKPLAVTCDECGEFGIPYDPLKNDAQAMALVKKFGLTTVPDDGGWVVVCPFGSSGSFPSNTLNRAICECVARMHKEKA